jgi:hypothetical protein
MTGWKILKVAHKILLQKTRKNMNEFVNFLGHFVNLHHIDAAHYGISISKIITDFFFRRKDMEIHEQQCPFKPIECPHCHLTFESAKYQNHFADCDMFPIECIQCKELIKQSELNRHRNDECPESIISCVFSDSGCNEKVRK